MKSSGAHSIRQKIQNMALFLVLATVSLGMVTSLAFSLEMEYDNLDRNLQNFSLLLAQAPSVEELLAGESDGETIQRYLNGVISNIQDIDAVVVADAGGVIRYSPDGSHTGAHYPEWESLAVFHGEEVQVDTGAGISGVERRAVAAVRDADGALLGFVSVGIGVRSMRMTVIHTVICFLILAGICLAVGLILSRHLSRSIKDSLMGYEPDVFQRLFQQREGMLDALDEGVLAIDRESRILYLNRAGMRMFRQKDRESVLGRQVEEVYPETQLSRVLVTHRSEYNIPLRNLPGLRAALADRIPIWENGKVVGALAIFRDRSEATALAEELTGARHLVEAMRAYAHDFINRLHIILGYIQLGRPEDAEEYILEISDVHRQSVSRVMHQIQDGAVAALLVGKTSRAAELGIHLSLDPESRFSGDGRFVPSGVLVTILGNLIENATDSLNRVNWKTREISVSIREEAEHLLLCVEDTGPGIPPELLPFIFQPNVSTKGQGHGIGLARIQELVHLYQGEIRVESEPRSGTAFFVTFYARPVSNPQEDSTCTEPSS